MNGIQQLLRASVDRKASDLYIGSGAKPILRINGELVPIDDHPILDKKTAEIYLLEVMDDPLKKKLQDSSDLDFSIEADGIARFRVNIFVQRNGISGVFRVIPEVPLSLEELQLPPQIQALTSLRKGLILITGPAGSGKSTTLAAMIKSINHSQKKHILTVEDPIEFLHQNNLSVIEQREVGTHTVSFSRALRAALREDPDVILVGEMRDLETISLAITAAETGHLVISTLHTQGAANTVDRVIDVFPPDQQAQIRTQLASTLEAVIWQKLLPAEKETVNGTKRIAALEILLSNHAVKNLIRKGQTYQIDSVIETNRKDGMQTMNHSLKTLLEQGLISEETYQKNVQE
ncbi:MAG: type IV pilus twitching motility protein PilT [Candidatus Gracilibacteria bacterium]